MKQIVFNADVGEGVGNDHQIMPYISWCNIACGAHAGDEGEIVKTIQLALQHDVKIGAHPSYPDRKNFGRKSMQMDFEDLVRSITQQIQLVKNYVEELGGELHHVKPHGALYNDAFVKKEVSKAILQSIKNVDKSLRIVTLKDSVLSYLCKDGFRVYFEAFADRNYNDDMTLVFRAEKDAILENKLDVFEHVKRMVVDGKIKTKTGKEQTVFFDTICVHGDNQNAVEIIRYLHSNFVALGYDLK
ncbi:5-oxoprolinase subunit PxpA [Aquimarina spongiae]|uniref:UPF0271 protein n=1 Tax=Aquimarina spongiae TaxID=570521 RepID=A0A1M6GAA9_9FLAO|nr:5-oxoprolinase subunit PxpA [Aquimarina spongiae]SHJ06858.1 UPF0271 protein [Aquimarina spongiae]